MLSSELDTTISDPFGAVVRSPRHQFRGAGAPALRKDVASASDADLKYLGGQFRSERLRHAFIIIGFSTYGWSEKKF